MLGDNHKIINNQFINFGSGSTFPIYLLSGNNLPATNSMSSDDVTNCRIAFNTFVNCNYNIFLSKSTVRPIVPTNNFIDNNIISQNSGAYTNPFIILNGFTSVDNLGWGTNTFRNNIFYNHSSSAHPVVSVSFTLPNTTGNIIGTDPELSLISGIYQPSPTSDANNGAYNSDNSYDFVTYDIVGNSRAAIKDIGCYEQNTSNKTAYLMMEESNNFSDLEASVIPNPVTDSFEIKGLMRTSTVEIFDINGKLVLKKKDYKGGTFNIKHFNSGLYLVNIRSTNKITTVKLLKN